MSTTCSVTHSMGNILILLTHIVVEEVAFMRVISGTGSSRVRMEFPVTLCDERSEWFH